MKASIVSCIAMLSSWSLFAAVANSNMSTEPQAQSLDGLSALTHILVIRMNSPPPLVRWKQKASSLRRPFVCSRPHHRSDRVAANCHRRFCLHSQSRILRVRYILELG
jgi:hypothetical protein